MISTTVFLYATALFTLFAAVTAQAKNYTTYQQFMDDLPACTRDCFTVDAEAIRLTCGETNFECVCSQTITFTAGANRSMSCLEACPDSDEAAFTQASTNIFDSCLPLIIANPAAFNLTTQQLEDFGFIDSNNDTSSNTTTPSNVTSTGSPVATQTTNGASSLLVSSLLIAAVPAVLSALF